MGTASTMACITATLGLMPLKGASAPAVSSARVRIAEETGAIAVRLAQRHIDPQSILSRESFLNAIIVLQAIGGSTNAIVHLMAIINRHPKVQGTITLNTFDEIGAKTPLLIDLKPSGENYMTDFHNAGGMLALLHTLRSLLYLDAMTIFEKTLGELLDSTPFRSFELSRSTVRPLSNPIYAKSSLVVLKGNLAPEGAVLKVSAAENRSLLQHSGPAVVFEGTTDLAKRIDDPELDVTENNVLVLKGIGPIGNPGMPEAGLIPIPRKLAARGITDMLRLSDGRMSGTASGTIILHVAPESAIPSSVFGIVENGDIITLDLTQRSLRIELQEGEINRRLRVNANDKDHKRIAERQSSSTRGYRALYERSVNQADKGADFDFLTASGSG